MAFLLNFRLVVWVIKWLSEYICDIIMRNHYIQDFFIQMYAHRRKPISSRRNQPWVSDDDVCFTCCFLFLRKDKIMYIFWKWAINRNLARYDIDNWQVDIKIWQVEIKIWQVWWYISATSCRMIMSTWQICHVCLSVMYKSTSQIIMLPCQKKSWKLVAWYLLL